MNKVVSVSKAINKTASVSDKIAYYYVAHYDIAYYHIPPRTVGTSGTRLGNL
jgi:hypothetical protein